MKFLLLISFNINDHIAWHRFVCLMWHYMYLSLQLQQFNISEKNLTFDNRQFFFGSSLSPHMLCWMVYLKSVSHSQDQLGCYIILNYYTLHLTVEKVVIVVIYKMPKTNRLFLFSHGSLRKLKAELLKLFLKFCCRSETDGYLSSASHDTTASPDARFLHLFK